MEIDRKEAGDAAEMAALHYLKQRGLRLITRNYRCKMGEIDLIMLDGSILALIEVRARSSQDFGGAAASVGYRKQRRLIAACRHLLMTRADLRKLRARFDVVAFDQSIGSRSRIEWLKDAFRESR